MSQVDWMRLLEAGHAEPPGWFGKLSVLGDFAHRRLPQEVVEALDAWLSQGMATSRTQLGDAWLESYLTGPLWRFAWAPGVISTQWWFGVLMPSVDNVGRYFPLVVARAAPAVLETAEGLSVLDQWYGQVATALLGTLQGGASVEAFEAALAAATPWAGVVPELRPEAQTLPGRERCVLPGPASLAQWSSGLVLRDSMQRYQGHSFWWPDGEQGTSTSLSIAPGLPAAEHFSLLLQGQW